MQRRKFKSYAYGRSMHSADWHVDVTVGAKGLSGNHATVFSIPVQNVMNYFFAVSKTGKPSHP